MCLSLLQAIQIWFYREPGHGRGLVDAMSSFGCKRPLRQMIENEDKWFNEMKYALKNHFKEDATKLFCVINPQDLIDKIMDRKSNKLEGCCKMENMSVSSAIITTLFQFKISSDFSTILVSPSIIQYFTSNPVTVNTPLSWYHHQLYSTSHQILSPLILHYRGICINYTVLHIKSCHR